MLDGANGRALLHGSPEREWGSERDPPPSPHPVLKRDRRQKPAAGRMAIPAEFVRRQSLEKVEPVPQWRQGRSLDERLLLQTQSGSHQARVPDVQRVAVDLRLSSPLPQVREINRGHAQTLLPRGAGCEDPRRACSARYTAASRSRGNPGQAVAIPLSRLRPRNPCGSPTMLGWNWSAQTTKVAPWITVAQAPRVVRFCSIP